MIGTIRQHYLLDTVAVVAQLNGDPGIIALLSVNVEVSIPVIALGELYAGAEKSTRTQENLRRVDEFAKGANILFCDEQTAREYAKIADGLRRKGRPIPQNDMWIAALATHYRLTVLTRDQHFSYIDGLPIQTW